ncbi:MAG: type II secretion system protein [Caldisericia bacterium]|nr:type II secretion system protein [Caldisericia bacterium]
MRNFNKGFTLIELFVTLAVLIVLIGGIIYISPKFISKQRLKNAAWQLLSDIKEVQERARGQLEFLKIEIYPDSNSYRFEKRKNAFSQNNSLEIVNRTLSSDVVIKSVSYSSQNSTKIAPPISPIYFGFDEWGIPVDDSKYQIEGFLRIILESKSLVDSQGKNFIVEINISPGTGRGYMDGPKPSS